MWNRLHADCTLFLEHPVYTLNAHRILRSSTNIKSFIINQLLATRKYISICIMYLLIHVHILLLDIQRKNYFIEPITLSMFLL